MKKIYAPWRSKYIVKEDSQENSNTQKCPFCIQINGNLDQKNYILKRLSHSFIILNLYPYNAGHIMILPYEHKANLEDLNSETRFEIIEWISKINIILKDNLKPDGLNIGINMGKYSGGSIPQHLHFSYYPQMVRRYRIFSHNIRY